jgi:hypothetical protein
MALTPEKTRLHVRCCIKRSNDWQTRGGHVYACRSTERYSSPGSPFSKFNLPREPLETSSIIGTGTLRMNWIHLEIGLAYV